MSVINKNNTETFVLTFNRKHVENIFNINEYIIYAFNKKNLSFPYGSNKFIKNIYCSHVYLNIHLNNKTINNNDKFVNFYNLQSGLEKLTEFRDENSNDLIEIALLNIDKIRPLLNDSALIRGISLYKLLRIYFDKSKI